MDDKQKVRVNIHLLKIHTRSLDQVDISCAIVSTAILIYKETDLQHASFWCKSLAPEDESYLPNFKVYGGVYKGEILT